MRPERGTSIDGSSMNQSDDTCIHTHTSPMSTQQVVQTVHGPCASTNVVKH